MNIDMAYMGVDKTDIPIVSETMPSRLGYQTNDVYAGFPPLMSDGRSITAAYQPEAVHNEQIIKDNNIKSNWEYRQYLQKNAVKVMKDQYIEASNDCGYFDRYADYKYNNGVPLLYDSFIDKRRPIFYEDSDLKQTYLTREQLDAMKMAPTISLPAMATPSSSITEGSVPSQR
jgi:hypothetical protein